MNKNRLKNGKLTIYISFFNICFYGSELAAKYPVAELYIKSHIIPRGLLLPGVILMHSSHSIRSYSLKTRSHVALGSGMVWKKRLWLIRLIRKIFIAKQFETYVWINNVGWPFSMLKKLQQLTILVPKCDWRAQHDLFKSIWSLS